MRDIRTDRSTLGPGNPGDAAIVNLTPVDATAPGYGLLISSDTTNPPIASNTNYAPSTIDPNVALAPIGTDGNICFTNSPLASVHLIADHLGTITTNAYTPANPDGTPKRLTDTRQQPDPEPAPTPTPPTPTSPITAAAVSDAVLSPGTCFGGADSRPLTDGTWGPNDVGWNISGPTKLVLGDFDGDLIDDAAFTVLCHNGGMSAGSAWIEVVVWPASADPIALKLGDHIDLTGLWNVSVANLFGVDREFLVEWEARTANDPMCCPSITAIARFTVENGAILYLGDPVD